MLNSSAKSFVVWQLHSLPPGHVYFSLGSRGHSNPHNKALRGPLLFEQLKPITSRVHYKLAQPGCRRRHFMGHLFSEPFCSPHCPDKSQVCMRIRANHCSKNGQRSMPRITSHCEPAILVWMIRKHHVTRAKIWFLPFSRWRHLFEPRVVAGYDTWLWVTTWTTQYQSNQGWLPTMKHV